MLVTFKTNAHSDITLFGTPAIALLKLMGQSGNVPGAILAEDVPEALAQLREGLANINAQAMTEESSQTAEAIAAFDDDEKEPTIGLDKRAGPLVSLLEAAVTTKDNVLWES